MNCGDLWRLICSIYHGRARKKVRQRKWNVNARIGPVVRACSYRDRTAVLLPKLQDRPPRPHWIRSRAAVIWSVMYFAFFMSTQFCFRIRFCPCGFSRTRFSSFRLEKGPDTGASHHLLGLWSSLRRYQQRAVDDRWYGRSSYSGLIHCKLASDAISIFVKENMTSWVKDCEPFEELPVHQETEG